MVIFRRFTVWATLVLTFNLVSEMAVRLFPIWPTQTGIALALIAFATAAAWQEIWGKYENSEGRWMAAALIFGTLRGLWQ